MGTTADVARIAQEVCAKFATGYRGGLSINGVHFELNDVGYCSEFVHECACAAAGEPTFGRFQEKYFGADAIDTERLLKLHAQTITAQQADPGDIVCFNRNSGSHGHIAIHISPSMVAENTSSRTRGPGFVLSRYDAIGRERITGYYHLPELERAAAAPGPARLVVLLPGSDRHAQPLYHEGTHYLSVRDVARMFGVDVIDRRAQDGKIYLRAPGEAGG